MKTRIMLDLETLGTAPGSAILAIGAVRFGSGLILSEFYEKISLVNAVACGLKMDPETILWWLQQSEESRAEFAKPGRSLSHVLEDFTHWCHRILDIAIPQNGEIEMWGNGAAFDNVLLSAAYDRVGLNRPWKYSNDRCYRTVKNLYPDVEIVRDGTHHNALDDARSQAMHLMKMLPNL